MSRADTVIPTPATRTALEPPGVHWAADNISVRAEDPRLENVAAVVTALLEPHQGVGQGQTITLRFGDVRSAPPPPGNLPGSDETHRVTVTTDGIACQARTSEGVFRAAVTAVQMIATQEPAIGQQLDDAPRCGWRGLMLDPARAFIAVSELRRVIDLAALYKLNVLHLHLSDDQGWRLEIPRLPELTEAQGPYYTADDYHDIQEYAAARFITVIPEIDLPGHCGALRRAVPGLPTAPAADEYPDPYAFMDVAEALNLEDDATLSLVRRIYAQVCELTAGPFMHIGADEVAGVSPDSYSAAVRRLREIVRANGKRPLAWQEASRAGSTSEDVVQHWFDPGLLEHSPPDMPVEAVAAFRTFFAPATGDLGRILDDGGRVILSDQSHLYLDRGHELSTVPAAQAEDARRLGLPFYPRRTLEYLAAWDPADCGVPEDRIAGIEAALWGETITGIDDMTFLLLPRITAVAETAWTGRPAAWQEYRERVARHGRMWDRLGLTFFASTEIPWPGEAPQAVLK